MGGGMVSEEVFRAGPRFSSSSQGENSSEVQNLVVLRITYHLSDIVRDSKCLRA